MKGISRRDFLKGAVVAAGAAAAAGIPVLAESEKLYTPGTYMAEAHGVQRVIVSVTFDESSIVDVQVNASGESEHIGQLAVGVVVDQIMEAQSAEIDGIGGATLTSRAIKEAVQLCILQAKGEIPVMEISMDEPAEEVPAWLGAEPEIPEDLIADTWTTDILIVGAGAGGLAAAAYAADKGYDFRLIEKVDSVCRARGWYAAVDSELMKESGAEPVDRSRLRRELQRASSGKCNMKVFNTWINESAAMHDFVTKVYAELDPEAVCTPTVGEEAAWPAVDDTGYYFPNIEHTWSSKVARNRNDAYKMYLENRGYAIDFNTSLIKLEKDGDRVCGAIARKTDSGEYVRIVANQGVILTTGGYPANPDMMKALDPMGSSVVTCLVCSPTNQGDGIKAALWAGASMQPESAPMIFDRGILKPGLDAGYFHLEDGNDIVMTDEGQFGMGSQPFLKVNRRGERFANESGTYDNILYAAYNQPGHVYAMVFDNNMPEDVQRFHTIGCSAGVRKNAEARLEQFIEKTEDGWTFMADTLDELADKMGFEGEAKETFLATCERYNELYDMQNDEDFGKPAYRLSELRNGPFYGFWMGGCLLTTEQGILTNEKAQAIDENKDVVEGLYVAGDCSGGFFYNNYPCLLPGVACGRTMTMAIKAVKVASGEEM